MVLERAADKTSGAPYCASGGWDSSAKAARAGTGCTSAWRGAGPLAVSVAAYADLVGRSWTLAEREAADRRGAAGPDKAEVSGSSPPRPTLTNPSPTRPDAFPPINWSDAANSLRRRTGLTGTPIEGTCPRSSTSRSPSNSLPASQIVLAGGPYPTQANRPTDLNSTSPNPALVDQGPASARPRGACPRSDAGRAAHPYASF